MKDDSDGDINGTCTTGKESISSTSWSGKTATKEGYQSFANFLSRELAVEVRLESTIPILSDCL